ncbi:MAG: flagellar biosynthesis protein FlhB [Nitrospinota bacterium]
MPENDQQEKTEPASPKRREEARESGKVAKSQEVGSVVILMGALLVFYFSANFMLTGAGDLMSRFFRGLARVELDRSSLLSLLYAALWQMSYILGPFFLATVVFALVANVAQVGLLLAPKALKPNFSAVSPRTGIKKLFSSQGLVELVKSLLKIGIVGWVAWWTFQEEFPKTLPLIHQTPRQILAFWGSVAFKIFLRASLVWIFLALLDFAYRKWKMEKDMRMTKQEVKDELKQREGDPQVKARVRGIQREQARRRMMTAVPEADVVVTNPTHLAVALAYKPGAMDAPKVVAKGADLIAEQIRVVAREHDVPVIRNRKLARDLYESVDVDQYVPVELYQAVAEVLAFVYRLRGKDAEMAAATGPEGAR